MPFTNKHQEPDKNGSRKWLIGLLSGFILFFVVIAIVLAHRAVGIAESRGMRFEVIDIYTFSFVYLLFFFAFTTFPLLLVVSYRGIHCGINIGKIRNSLSLCGLKEVQLQDKISEFEEKNSWKAFLLPMLANLVFMFLLWSAAMFPDGLLGMLDNLHMNGMIKIGLNQIFPNLAKKASLVTWIFFGAYWYGITVMIRRWMQSDLTTNVLWKLDVRFAVAVILGLLLIEFVPEPIVSADSQASKHYIAGLAFLTGVLPDVFLRWLTQQMKRVVNIEGESASQLFSPSELQKRIDGMSFWQAGRLAEEGIESVQDLAMKQIPDLLVHTRFDTPLLLSWVDQALLCTQLGTTATALKRVFIRSASELIYLAQQEAGLEGVLQSIDDVEKRDPARDNAAGQEPVLNFSITLPMLQNAVAGLENGPNLLYIATYWSNVSHRGNLQ